MAITTANIQQLYIAYFSRPADPTGLAYWESVSAAASAAGTPDADVLNSISDSFAASAEYQANFTGMNATAIVNKVYMNLFSHAPDPAGLLYWSTKLTAGDLTVSNIVRAVSQSAVSAGNDDGIAFQSKVLAAEAFTGALNTTDEILGYSGLAAGNAAKAFIAGINSTATLQSAIAPAALDATVLAVTTATTPPVPPVVPTFALEVSTAAVNEGGTALFTLSTTNVAAGSQYAYTITGVSAADVVGGSLTGVATIGTDGKAVIQVTLVADALTEGAETLTLTVAGQSSNLTVTDTSTAPVQQTSWTITPTDIVMANSTAAGVVTVLVGDTGGSKTVTLNTDAVTASSGFIVSGNSDVSVTAAGGNDTISVVSTGTITLDGGSGNDILTLVGAGNNTVTAGTGNDTVTTGAGNDTISAGAGNDNITSGAGNDAINAGIGNDTITSGDGNDSIVFAADDFNALDAVDAGAGDDTVTISGNGNVVGGSNLVGVEHLVLNGTTVSVSDADLATYVADGLVDISGSPTSSIVTITAAAGSTVDLAGLTLVSLQQLNVDATGGAGNVTLVLTAAQIAQVGSLAAAVGDTLTIETSVAGLTALGTKAPAATVQIVDTLANILAAGASLDGLDVTLDTPVSVAGALTLLASGATVNYALEDSAANLALAPQSVYTNANTVTATTTANAAQASQIQGTLVAVGGFAAGTVTLNVADTVSNLANYWSDAIDADAAAGSGNATVAEAAAIHGLNAAATYAIVDSVANVLGAGAAELNAASSVTLTDAAAAADIAAINAALVGAAGGLTAVASGYALTDTRANLLAASASVIGAAGNITFSDAFLTVANALSVLSLANTGTKSYVLADTISTLLAASASVVASASSVSTSTGTLTAAQLISLVNKYGAPKVDDGNIVVQDTAANLATLTSTHIGEATTVVPTDTMTAAQAVALKALADAKLVALSYSVTDTAANLAASVAVAGNPAYLDGASSVTVSDAATVGQITAINSALGSVGGGLAAVATGYTLQDTATALAGAAAGVRNGATNIIATGNATVAQATTIDAATNSGTNTYSISDTATALAGAAAGVLNGATNLIATGSATVAQATTIDAATNSGTTTYSIGDDVANLAGASDALLSGATTVTLNDIMANLFPAGVASAQLARADVVVASDSLANVTLASAPNKAAVTSIVLTDVALGDTDAAAVNALAALKPTTYSLVDVYADLVPAVASAAVTTLVAGAASITLTGAVSVAQFNTLDGLTAATLTAAITDTVASLSAADAANAITAALASSSAITISDTTASVAQAATLSGRGVSIAGLDVVDTAAAINAGSAAVVAGGASLTVSDNGVLTVSAAVATKAFSADGSSYGNYNLSDTATDILAANISLVNFATNITVTGTATAAQADTLSGLTSMGTISYSVSDTATAIASASAGARNSATNITATSNATVAEATTIEGATNGGTTTYSISDSAANIVAATASVRNGATILADSGAGGPATVAQATIIEAATNSGATTIASLSDTATAVAATSNAVLNVVTGTVTATGSATGTQATSLAAFTKAVVYSVSDTAANVAAAAGAGLNEAVNVTATGNASVSEATAIDAASNSGTTSYNISDSAASIVAAIVSGAANDVIDRATNLTATGPATLADATKILAATNGGTTTYIITDSFANLMKDSNVDGVVDGAAVIAGADTVTVTDTALTVAQATALTGTGAGSYVYSIVDNDANLVAALDPLTAALLDGATSVTGYGGTVVNLDTVAGAVSIVGTKAQLDALSTVLKTGPLVYEVTVADLTSDSAFYSTLPFYRVTDTAANLASGNALVGTARALVASTAATMAEATAIASLGVVSFSYDLIDTGANLVAGAILNNATNVTATGTVTLAQASTISAATGATTNNTNYSISGADTSFAGVAAGNAVNFADSITVTGTAGLTAAQAQVLLSAANSGATTIALVTDTTTNLVALTKGSNDTITAIAFNAHEKATVAQVGTLQGLAGTVSYALEDSAANLTGSAGAALLNGASTNGTAKAIVATGNTTVAQATILDAATASDANTVFNVADSATNVLAASTALLAKDDDGAIVITDTSMTAATATSLAAFDTANTGFTITLPTAISDTQANLVLAANAAAVAAAATVAISNTVTVAQAAAVNALTGATLTYNLSDTYANLATGGVDTTNATNVTISNNVTTAQASNAAATFSAAQLTYSVRDTAASVAAGAAGLSGATTVVLTTAATVAQAGFLSQMSNLAAGYTISDTAANVQAALDTANALNAADRQTVLGASSITLTTEATVAQALGTVNSGPGTGDRGLYKVPGLSYILNDDAANLVAGLAGIDAAGVTGATLVRLTTDAGITVAQADTLTALANFDGYDVGSTPAKDGIYNIEDGYAAIQNGGLDLINDAGTVVANGTGSGETIDMSAFSRGVTINGLGGADNIFGTDYADVISGGAGVDSLTGGLGADNFVVGSGDTGITLVTADTILDFTTADDVISTNLTAGDVTIADGTALADFTAFVAAADVVLGGGVGAYMAYNADATGNGWLVIDEDASGNVNVGDTVIVLTGVNLVTEFVTGDIA